MLIAAEKIHLSKAKKPQQLIQNAEFRIENTHTPEKNGNIGGHGPGQHQHGFIDPPRLQLRGVQAQGNEKAYADLQDHIDCRPEERRSQSA